MNAAVHDLRSGGAVGVYEEAVLVGFIVTLGIAVTERELQSRLVGNLPAELGDALLDGSVHGGVDGVEGLLVGFRDNEGYGVLIDTAKEIEDFQAIGVQCREILIELGNYICTRAKHSVVFAMENPCENGVFKATDIHFSDKSIPAYKFSKPDSDI